MDDPIGAVAGQAWGIAVEGNAQSPALIEQQAFAVALELEQPAALLVDQGGQGMAGPPGPDGASALQSTAGETLSALRAVYEMEGQVYYLDYRAGDHIDLLLGITLTAAGSGSPINVQRSGVIDDDGWSWTHGRIWLGADGALTQIPPADGYDVLIGSAVSATRIIINIQDPIKLE